MLRCDQCAMNTYAAMSWRRLLALTMPTRQREFRAGTAREDEARQTCNRKPTVVTTSVGEEIWF
jgi:hypothetical protein